MAELPEDKCWLAVAPSFNHFAIFHSQCNVQCKCCYWISSTQLTLKMQEHNLHCYSAHKGWEVRAIFCRKQCILLLHLIPGTAIAYPDRNCVSSDASLV